MKPSPGFSLIELLVVVAIISILMVVAMPAINSIGRGREMEVAAIQISDAIALARQTALSKNRPTEVRFYSHPGRMDPTQAYRTLQVFTVQDDGTSQPLARPTRLPDSLAISDDTAWSSLLAPGTLEELSATNIPGIGSVNRTQILRFRSNGRTGLLNLNNNYHLTILPMPTVQTNNFATVQIDPLTGRTRTFRP